MSCIIFENASVFDGVNPEITEPRHVFIENDEIKEISWRPIKSAHAERIDCRGRTLMPGLIDNHVHIYFDSISLSPPEPPITYRAQYAHEFLRHILSCGVTTVRDVGGGDHGMALAAAQLPPGRAG
jgi:imidazolonepropionase-like amidohydrolase